MLCGLKFSDFVLPSDEEWIYSGGLASTQASAVKFTAVGDLMVHGPQAEDALSKGGGAYNYDHSFSYIKKYFAGSDIVAGNLETVLAGPEAGYQDYPRFAVTDEFAYALKNAGFTFLTTANNHSLDQGERGLLRTLETLDGLGIGHTGTYSSEDERERITLIEKNGIVFAVLSYTYGVNGNPLPDGREYLVNMLSAELYRADIARAQSLDPDFIVVMPHMGNEYETYTRDVFRDTMIDMFYAGADVVLASHPHVLQPCEVFRIAGDDGEERTCFAAYSMGNFISGQRTEPREAGIIYNMFFERNEAGVPEISRITYIPTWVRFYRDGVSRDIAVLPVYDTLNTMFWGGYTGLSREDMRRVEAVQLETTALIGGSPVPLGSMAPEYIIYKSEDDG
ncbi:MAG: CapA family protein [Clostridiales bacterium]|nr:CapA family protein [Clostridiales bacterium]